MIGFIGFGSKRWIAVGDTSVPIARFLHRGKIYLRNVDGMWEKFSLGKNYFQSLALLVLRE